MFLCTALLGVAPAAATPAPPPVASHDDGETAASQRMTITFLAGRRWYRDEGYEDLGDELGLETTFAMQLDDSALGFEFGTSFSFESLDRPGADYYASTFELYGGPRATAMLADGHLRPYVAAGPCVTFLGFAADSDHVDVFGDEATFGLYARAGVTWVFDGGFCVGLDYRELFGTDVEILGEDADIDFGQLALTFGVAL